MDKSKWGVHEAHCCVLHGCKYGDPDCPVVNKQTKQKYVCEECGFEGIKTVDEVIQKELTYDSNNSIQTLIQQKIEAKQKLIEQLLNGKASSIQVKDQFEQGRITELSNSIEDLQDILRLL